MKKKEVEKTSDEIHTIIKTYAESFLLRLATNRPQTRDETINFVKVDYKEMLDFAYTLSNELHWTDPIARSFFDWTAVAHDMLVLNIQSSDSPLGLDKIIRSAEEITGKIENKSLDRYRLWFTEHTLAVWNDLIEDKRRQEKEKMIKFVLSRYPDFDITLFDA